MTSLVLPPDPRRPELAAFWTVASLLAGALVIFLLRWVGWTPTLGAGLALIGLLVLPGVLSPGLARRAYSAWNRWVGRYVRLAREIVVRVCHAAVFTPAGVAGSRIPRGRPPFEHTGWRERGTTPPDAYASGGAEPASEPAGRGWVGEMLDWCRGSGHRWTVALLPYLRLLEALETRRDEQPPSDIYTLY